MTSTEETIIRNMPKAPKELIVIIHLLMVTGIRGGEVTIRRKWKILNQNEIMLLPLKKNKYRIFQKSDIPHHFWDYIDKKNNDFDSWTVRKINYHLNKLIEQPVSTGKKNIVSHVFRHLKIKELINNGMSDNEIKDFTGHNSTASLISYKSSVIP